MLIKLGPQLGRFFFRRGIAYKIAPAYFRPCQIFQQRWLA